MDKLDRNLVWINLTMHSQPYFNYYLKHELPFGTHNVSQKMSAAKRGLIKNVSEVSGITSK